jgi:hypothetical protein
MDIAGCTMDSPLLVFMNTNSQNKIDMRKSSFIYLFTAVMALGVMISCENEPEPQSNFLPEKFSVDIPSSISSETSAGRVKGDSLNGNLVYLNLATFIAVGSGSAKLVEEFIDGIQKHALGTVETATFNSVDDQRKKNLVVRSDIEFEGTTWQHMLILTDAESEGNPDGGHGLQIFWNQSAPIHGVAIVKPYNCNRKDNAGIKDALFRINYDEQTAAYDAQMEVSISGLPLPADNPFAISTLRMFAGRKGDVVDVYGNSSHPNTVFFTGQKGFSWAFVAAGNNTSNIGVAEVGLPPISLDNTDRAMLLKEYSIKNVFTTQIQTAFPFLPPTAVAAFLETTSAPGYFDNKGFVSGGKSPGAAHTALATRLDGLSPYNPKVTSTLTIAFREE